MQIVWLKKMWNAGALLSLLCGIDCAIAKFSVHTNNAAKLRTLNREGRLVTAEGVVSLEESETGDDAVESCRDVVAKLKYYTLTPYHQELANGNYSAGDKNKTVVDNFELEHTADGKETNSTKKCKLYKKQGDDNGLSSWEGISRLTVGSHNFLICKKDIYKNSTAVNGDEKDGECPVKNEDACENMLFCRD